MGDTMTVWGNGSKTQPRSSSPSGQYGAPRPGGRKHAGTDFVGYTDLRAITAGVVTTAGQLTADAGQTVAIDLDGKYSYGAVTGCTVTIVRMHIAAGTIAVRKGQRVAEGTHIGAMGNTGNAEGVCDHVEIRYWKGGRLIGTVDPRVWIAQRIAAEAKPSPAPAGGGSKPVPGIKGRGDDMIVVIKGKAKVRRGGIYYISGGVGHLLGTVDATHAAPQGAVQLVDEGQITALYAATSGLS